MMYVCLYEKKDTVQYHTEGHFKFSRKELIMVENRIIQYTTSICNETGCVLRLDLLESGITVKALKSVENL